MSFRLAAPYPGIETISFLPNPELTDVRQLDQEMTIRKSMSDFRRTYVQTSDRNVFNYTFILTRQKALEVRAFIEAYYRSTVEILDHDGIRWAVFLTSNPFEINGAGRAADFPGEEYATIPLTFEGEQL